MLALSANVILVFDICYFRCHAVGAGIYARPMGVGDRAIRENIFGQCKIRAFCQIFIHDVRAKKSCPPKVY